VHALRHGAGRGRKVSIPIRFGSRASVIQSASDQGGSGDSGVLLSFAKGVGVDPFGFRPDRPLQIALSSRKIRSPKRVLALDIDQGLSLMRRACCLLPHQDDQTAHLTTVALNDGGKLGPLGDRHADTFDDYIINLVCAVVVNEPPIHSQR
jgi:hypothetical protein